MSECATGHRPWAQFQMSPYLIEYLSRVAEAHQRGALDMQNDIVRQVGGARIQGPTRATRSLEDERTNRMRTRAGYPGPPSDGVGKIIRKSGGAGSRTRVRKRSAQATTCVSGDLVFVARLARRRGILVLSLLGFRHRARRRCAALSLRDGGFPRPQAPPRVAVSSAV